MNRKFYLKRIAIMGLIGGWFLGHAWKGLFVYYNGDDMMNLYRAWMLPAWKIAVANLTPFTTVYRPVGTAVYRLCFATMGWSPLGFRVVAYALMLVNIWLVYRVARFISESSEVAVVGAFLFSYHQRLMDIYTENGTIYDVLSCAFFLFALLSYLRGRPWLFLISYVVALNSKEMAGTLPLVLLAYEWIFRRRVGSAVLWLAAGITAIAYVVKTSAPEFANVPDYRIHLTVRQFFVVTRSSLGALFYLRQRLNTTQTVLTYILMWGFAILSRRKALLFSAAYATLTPLPISFIDYRGFFVMYLPLVGWAIYFATVLVEGRDWLWKAVWKRSPLPPGTWEPERIALLFSLGYCLSVLQANDPYRSFENLNAEQAYIHTLKDALAVRPSLPHNSRVWILNDPFPSDALWDPLYVVRLSYRDETIEVKRGQEVGPGMADMVLAYDGQRYMVR